MSATNKTTNYDLPIFVGTDKPSWLGDWNSAMTAIDTAIAGAKSTGDSATTVAGQAKSTAEAASETATAASETAAAASTAASNATTIANNANTQAGDAKTDAHAALEMATELQEKFAGNRMTRIKQLYPSLIGKTDFSGEMIIVSSNYNVCGRGSLYFTKTGWNKIIDILYQNAYYILIGVINGNPYNLTPATTIDSASVFLGTYLGYLLNTDSSVDEWLASNVYMFYNTNAQRTEIYCSTGINYSSGKENDWPSQLKEIRVFPNFTYIDNDIEAGAVTT